MAISDKLWRQFRDGQKLGAIMFDKPGRPPSSFRVPGNGCETGLRSRNGAVLDHAHLGKFGGLRPLRRQGRADGRQFSV